MTDPEYADRTYIEPLTPEVLGKVLERERPGGDPTAEMYQGGIFTVAEEVLNPAPLPKKKRKK